MGTVTQTIGWVISKSYLSGSVQFLILKEETLVWSWTAHEATIFKDNVRAKEIISNLNEKTEIDLIKVEISY